MWADDVKQIHLDLACKAYVDSRSALQDLGNNQESMKSGLYLQDRKAVAQSGLSKVVPEGAQSLIVASEEFTGEGTPNRITIISWSGNANEFSSRDRTWTSSIAKKLAGVLSSIPGRQTIS